MAGTSQAERASVLSVLEQLSEGALEGRLVDLFYGRFFEACPEAVPLFGVHSIGEREEMLRETLKSLLAVCDGEPWLEENLRALGASHVEYGVEPPMYPPFVRTFVAVVEELVGDRLEPGDAAHLGRVLEGICSSMARG